jgi:hypothetical protein
MIRRIKGLPRFGKAHEGGEWTDVNERDPALPQTASRERFCPASVFK